MIAHTLRKIADWLDGAPKPDTKMRLIGYTSGEYHSKNRSTGERVDKLYIDFAYYINEAGKREYKPLINDKFWKEEIREKESLQPEGARLWEAGGPLPKDFQPITENDALIDLLNRMVNERMKVE